VQRTLDCVAPVIVQAILTKPVEFEHTVRLRVNNDEPFRLNRTHLSLDISQVVRVITPSIELGPDWHIRSIGYEYTLSHVDAGEIVAYHWHPSGISEITTPHVHIGPAATGRDAVVRPGTLHKAHFPTGVVTLESVVRLAITEFDTEPRRDDWESITTTPS
jgi:hypothetical protein